MRRGLLYGSDGSDDGSTAKVLVGMPFLSSPANLAFWLALAHCTGRPASRQLLTNFRTATATKDKAELAEYFCQYNAELVARLLATPGVSGLHVMPITPSAKRMALEHATGWGNASR